MAIRRIGQILVDLGFITDVQREMLLEEQQARPEELLGQIAISLDMIDDEQLAQALAEQMGLQVITLADVAISSEVLSYVTEPMAHLYRIVPVSFRDNTLTVSAPWLTTTASNCSSLFKFPNLTTIGKSPVAKWAGKPKNPSPAPSSTVRSSLRPLTVTISR